MQYETIDDELFSWLMNSFLPYLDSWKYSIESWSGGQFSPSQKSDEAVQITIFSIIDLIKYLLSNDVSYVLTERFCQDPLFWTTTCNGKKERQSKCTYFWLSR